MRHRSITTLSAVAAALLIASGCATESPNAPQRAAAAPEGPSLSKGNGPLNAPLHVTPLMRNTPLPPNVSVSATIGVLGGVLSLPAAGLTVIVPPLAVARPTVFTIAARPGLPVAYDFGPAGSHFTVPLVATQSLANTQARHGGTINPLALSVGYYAEGESITAVTELLNVSVDLLNQASVFSIWHFSGYMFATGRGMSQE